MSLFQKSVEKKYLKELDAKLIDEKHKQFQSYFGNPLIQQNIRNAKEEQFQEGFLRELFVSIFGYTLNPLPNYNLTTELKNIANSKKADGAILRNEEALAIIELKGTNTTDLDSIESQAFGYKNHHPNCVYVITSNFEKLRFYIQNAIDYIDFDLFNLTREQFSLMWLCLAEENLLKDLPLKIKELSVLQEENITKTFYADYSRFRETIFTNLVKNNPNTDKLLLFKKTQKLLDRFLFIFFAEDRLLLPPNSITEIVKQWDTLKDLDAYIPLYDRFKLYFNYMNTGHKGKKHDIFAYNGGLFAPDEILDTIIIDDDILYESTLKLSQYDYETEVDVNILGHIFEHSITDIEHVQAEIKGENIESQKTKRKKDGIFYTPKYITKYIVENTIGRLCSEKRKELDIIDEEYVKGFKNRKKSTISALDNKLKTYRSWLLSLTILDPACGSGAFLNQALDFLIKEHRKIDELTAQLYGASIVFSDITNDILEKNIYGVDINEESIEIAKLSLWLKTAQKGRKLNKLNNNIKCGNSLIDDPTIVGEKAFNWQQEFPEIFAKGGFDVVIGNPPYVQISEYQLYYNNTFKTSRCRDLYTLFYEKGISLLKNNGYFSYITPSLFIKGIKYNTLRDFLLQNTTIIEISEQGDGVFKDVQMPTAILTAIKVKSDVQDWDFYIPNNNILKKIEKNAIQLLTFSKIRRGLEIGKDKVIDYQPNFIKIITGEDVSRYQIHSYHSINQEVYAKFKKDNDFFNGERIIIRETGNRITSLLVNENLQQNRSLYSIIIDNEIISYKYLLGLLNSKLIQFYYRSKYAANTDIFPKIRIVQVKELPIILSNSILKKEIEQNVDELMLSMASLKEINMHFLSFIKAKINIDKISRNLNNWHEIDENLFLKELNFYKIDFQEESKWLNFFKEQKFNFHFFKEKILIKDKEIDQMVYQLYSLTEEEIKIVEESVK